MPATDIDTRSLILRSAKNEFLSVGYQRASLRRICRNAGVTTGAFYSQFSRKEELFVSLVEPMLEGFHRMYESVIAKELADMTTGVENELISITYAINHKDEFRLLFECSEGTKYEGFKERLVDQVFYPGYQAVFDRYAGRPVDPALVRIILRMKFEEYMELIYGDYSMVEVKKLITQMTAFSEAGFYKLIEIINTET